MKREYEIYRFLMEDFRLKHGLKQTAQKFDAMQKLALYEPADGSWCAIGKLVVLEDASMHYAIEIPFDPDLIPLMTGYEYCSLAQEMNPDQWLMLVIDEKIRIDTYRTLMQEGYDRFRRIHPVQKRMASHREMIYQDQAIPGRTAIRHENVPAQIAEMRRMYKPRRSLPNDEAFCFYQQAVFMKDYREQYDFHGTFFNIHPVYRMMTDSQLRGYFSWRTDLMENGQLGEKTPTAFLKLYVYELLHLIHSNSADTFEQLCAIEELYKGSDRLFMIELHRWINDFVIYYHLDEKAVSRRFEAEDVQAYRILADTSKDPASHSEEELRYAVQTLAKERIERSVFLRDNAEDAVNVLVKAYQMYVREAQLQGRSFFEDTLCNTINEFYKMFSSAVFYEREKPADQEVWIRSDCIYSCENGTWSRKRYIMTDSWTKLIGETDRLMRIACGYPKKLQPKTGVYFDLKILEETIREYLKEKAEAAKPVINIDMNALSSIRQDAALTRDSLLIEDEEEEEEEVEETAVEIPEEENDDTLFRKEERILLKALLEERSLSEITQLQGVSIALLCDEINEKLIDTIGDTVIAFDGDEPYLIEDYMEDIRELL